MFYIISLVGIFVQDFLDVDHLKSLLNLLQHCFYFMFRGFRQEACRVLVLQPGIEPVPLALEDEALTTAPPYCLLSIACLSCPL